MVSGRNGTQLSRNRLISQPFAELLAGFVHERKCFRPSPTDPWLVPIRMERDDVGSQKGKVVFFSRGCRIVLKGSLQAWHT